jgi:hypothetical protein
MPGRSADSTARKVGEVRETIKGVANRVAGSCPFAITERGLSSTTGVSS